MMYELPNFVTNPDPKIYLADDYLVCDFETTSIEHGTALNPLNRLLLACWITGRAQENALRNHSVWGDEFGQGRLVRAISKVSFLVCHNCKFELQYLKRCGLDLRKVVVFDTMLAEKVLAGNRKWSLSLDAIAQRRGLGGKDPTASRLIKAEVCPSEIPRGMLLEYCAQDVALTEQIFLQQRQELLDAGLLPVAYSRNLVCPVLADIEFNGMRLDADKVDAAYEQYTADYRAVEDRFKAIAGAVNFKSPKQLAEFLYDKLGFLELVDRKGNPERTAAGGRKTDKNTIPKLVATTDEQKAFKSVMAEVARLKIPVQNLEKMQKVCKESPHDPRMYATFNQAITDTGRLSSSARNGGMQFQNLDRGLRNVFRARADGWRLVESDGSQLEFRVAAYLGRDATAKADILAGVDVHAATAAVIGCDRQTAKAHTFRPLFGGKGKGKKERAYVEYFNARYSGISRTQQRWAMDAARDKLITTEWGLKFYFPEAEIQGDGYVPGTTKIYNYPIQSLATAEIIPLVLVILWHLLARFDDRVTLVNTIHDSVVAEVDPEVLDEYKQLAVFAFTDYIYDLLHNLYGISLDVPLGVGIKDSGFWGDGKEEKFESKRHEKALKPMDCVTPV